MTKRLSLGVLVLVLGAGCACEGSSSLSVSLVTDLIAGGDYVTISTRVTREDGAAVADASDRLGGGAVLVDPRTVARFAPLAAGRYVIEVTLVDLEGGELVTQRRLVDVRGFTSATIVIARTCVGAACGEGEACSGGACVPIGCSLDPDAGGCEETAASCTRDDECGEVTSECVTPRCVESACLEVPEHGRCVRDLVCSASGECVGDTYVDVEGQDGGAGGQDAGEDPNAIFVDCPLERLDLQGRSDIAAQIAQTRFDPDEVTEVVLARGDDPSSPYAPSPDALVAGPLAHVRDAPLLLFAPAVLTTATADALEFLAPTRVTIVGASDPTVEDRLRTMGYEVVVLSGSDRDDTAALVAQQLLTEAGGHEAVVVSADEANLRDGLAAAAAAADLDAPLLFVSASGVPARTSSAITELGITSVSLVGGTSAVPESVEDDLLAITNVRRYGGDDAASTAAVVARDLFVPPSAEVFLVRGLAPGEPSEAETYASGLTALGAPILFTVPTPPSLGDPTRGYLVDGLAGSVTLVGNRVAISDAIEHDVCVALAEGLDLGS